MVLSFEMRGTAARGVSGSRSSICPVHVIGKVAGFLLGLPFLCAHMVQLGFIRDNGELAHGARLIR